MGQQADFSHTLSKTEMAVSTTIRPTTSYSTALIIGLVFIAVFRTVPFHLEEMLNLLMTLNGTLLNRKVIV